MKSQYIQTIPKKYKPFEKLNFCSNRIVNYKFLVDDNGFHPILIGMGDLPIIWLYVKNSDGEIFPIIEDNVSKLNQIKIDIYHDKNKIEVFALIQSKEILMLELFYKYPVPDVSTIDLRPIGYKIFGTKEKLMIGESELKENIISGVDSIVSINKEIK